MQNTYGKIQKMVEYSRVLASHGYVPYPAHTHTSMYHAHCPSTTSNPLDLGWFEVEYIHASLHSTEQQVQVAYGKLQLKVVC